MAEPADLAAAVVAHLTRHVGPVAAVLRDDAGGAPIDVHVIAPSKARPHHTLFTTGLAAQPMTVPAGAEALRFAELVLLLPATWPLQGDAAAELRWAWPVRLLAQLARLPHAAQTWLGVGHTVPNGEPPSPFVDGTGLCCVLLLPPTSLPDDAETIEVGDGTFIHLLGVTLLHADELALRLSADLDTLLDRLDAAGVDEVLDPARPSVLAGAA